MKSKNSVKSEKCFSSLVFSQCYFVLKYISLWFAFLSSVYSLIKFWQIQHRLISFQKHLQDMKFLNFHFSVVRIFDTMSWVIFRFSLFFFQKTLSYRHCLEIVSIQSYSGPYFPAFGLNTEKYSISLRIQSECGKIRTRITPNTGTFYAVR